MLKGEQSVWNVIGILLEPNVSHCLLPVLSLGSTGARGAVVFGIREQEELQGRQCTTRLTFLLLIPEFVARVGHCHM